MNTGLLKWVCGLSVLVAGSAPALAQLNHPAQNFDSNTPIHVMPVQGKVYMLNIGGSNGVNITAQVGEQGIFLVDSGPPGLGEKLVQTLREHFGNKPVRFLVNTNSHLDHTGGNVAIVKTFGNEDVNAANIVGGARIISHLNTYNRISGITGKSDQLPQSGWPITSFQGEKKELFLNGEPIVIYSAPNAYTDGDVIVWFRSSDVVSAGDAFVMGNYPVIDSARGGSLSGLIDAGERIVDIAIPEKMGEGGTRVIPGHGRLCNENEVEDYVIMLAVIRDRVKDMVGKGMTFDQIKAAKPTLDYDGVVGGKKPFWTPAMFLEAAYRELSSKATEDQGKAGR